MHHDSPAPENKAIHHHENAVEGKSHHLSQEDAAKLSLEAQMHLKDHSNLWLQGNASDITGGGASKDQQGAGAKSTPVEYTKLKEYSAAASANSHDHGRELSTLQGANGEAARGLEERVRANSDLAKDTNTALDLHDKFHRGSAYGMDKKELEEISKMPKQLVTDEQKASVNRVLKDWDKIDDLKTSGPIKLLDRESASAGFDKRQQSIDNQKADLEKGRKSEAQMQTTQQARERIAQEASLAITPIQDVLNASKVQKGDGFYQVAQRMLSTDHQKHDDKEIKALTRVLKDEAAAEGRTIGKGDQLVSSDNFDRVMQKIRGTDVPSLAVPQL